MKKFLFLLLLLAGFSAYALNNTHCKNDRKHSNKSGKNKSVKSSANPLADLLMFPGLS
jgi:hypothetical protein